MAAVEAAEVVPRDKAVTALGSVALRTAAGANVVLMAVAEAVETASMMKPVTQMGNVNPVRPASGKHVETNVMDHADSASRVTAASWGSATAYQIVGLNNAARMAVADSVGSVRQASTVSLINA